MNKNGNKQMLESYKIFPFIAWGLTFGFALFVYNITVELKEITSDLEERTAQLQMKVETPSGELTDFDL
jgi:hypothetical protein